MLIIFLFNGFKDYSVDNQNRIEDCEGLFLIMIGEIGMMDIQTVTVIGVTGTMGANIAGIFASFGNAKVYCVGRNIEKVKSTIPWIVKSVRSDAIARKLIPADFSMLGQCVAESDLVFESSSENIKVKTSIAKQVSQTLQSHAISCTGTSGLSINEIASNYPEELRRHFFGVHMFNPPYSMSLCELTPNVYSDKVMQAELKEYLEKKLYRTVVGVKDSPAFLGNRIGFQFINEALQYAERFKDNGGIDYIDAVLGPFTGRSMAPLITADFVGLDIHKAIVDNICENTHDYARETFVLPEFVQKLVVEKKFGRKSNGGLYQLIRYENRFKRRIVFDISTGLYRDVIPYVFPFADKMKKYLAEGEYQKAFESFLKNQSLEAEICRHFLLSYIVYSLYAAKEVGHSIEAADDVMAAGFNWCPPLAMYQAFSTVMDVPVFIRENLPDLCGKVDIEELFAEIKPSKYDYRLYFKSGR